MAHERGEQIPPEQWGGFFDELNETCRGLRARVEAGAADGPPRVVAADAPFAGLVEGEEGLVIELAGGLSYSAGHPHRVTSLLEEGVAGQTITFTTDAGAWTRLLLAGGMTLDRAIGAAEDDSFTAVGGSAGAAGGSSAVPGARGGADADAGGLLSFGSSDDMGGVAEVAGGSVGDRDLSGEGAYDLTHDVYGGPTAELLRGGHAGPGSESAAAGQAALTGVPGSAAPGQGHQSPDILDGGSGPGVLDKGIDPIEGDKIVPGTDPEDGMLDDDDPATPA